MPMRFNPPPGWPVQSHGWAPPPGWEPDPSWPEPPAGWPLWLEDKPSARTASLSASIAGLDVDDRLTIGGGIAVFLGSLLPFIASSGLYAASIHTGARVMSALFGLLLAGGGVALRMVPANIPVEDPGRKRSRTFLVGVSLLVLAGFGTVGYVGFTVVGIAGYQQSDGFGFSAKVTFSPGIGLILAILGCIAAGIGTIRTLQRAPGTAGPYGSRPGGPFSSGAFSSGPGGGNAFGPGTSGPAGNSGYGGPPGGGGPYGDGVR